MLRTPLLLLALTSGCVTYTPPAGDLGTIARDVEGRAGGRFTFAEAAALALRQNPEVEAAAARARAAGAQTEPWFVEAQLRTGEDMVAVMLDPFAAVGAGPRGGALAELDAAAAAAVQELAVVRWRAVGAVAEAIGVEQALGDWRPPVLPIDADAFERAGLAGAVAVQRLRAAVARSAAETAACDELRQQNLATLRGLLGLPPSAALEVVQTGSFLQQPPGGDGALLRRPDLLLAEAQLRLADAAFRRAIAEQYPSLMLGPDVPLRADPLQLMAQLRLPVGARGRAVAARERREAAFAELQAQWLAAANGAAAAASTLAAAEALAAAAVSARQASDAELRTAQVAVQVEVDAFDRLADAAAMAVRDAAEERAALVARARARVRRAVAFGWPLAVPAEVMP